MTPYYVVDRPSDASTNSPSTVEGERGDATSLSKVNSFVVTLLTHVALQLLTSQRKRAEKKSRAVEAYVEAHLRKVQACLLA